MIVFSISHAPRSPPLCYGPNLSEVLNLQETLAPDYKQSAFGMSVFPIMLCLCQLLDSCCVLWDCNDMATVEVKEIVLSLLGRFGRVTAAMQNEGQLYH